MEEKYNLAQLVRMVARRKRLLDGLVARRDRLRKKLAKIDGEIVRLGGPSDQFTASRRRPKNVRPLFEFIRESLAENVGGLDIREIAKDVLARGYKTSSMRFEGALYQCLYNNMKALVYDEKTAKYRLKSKRKSSAAVKPDA